MLRITESGGVEPRMARQLDITSNACNVAASSKGACVAAARELMLIRTPTVCDAVAASTCDHMEVTFESASIRTVHCCRSLREDARRIARASLESATAVMVAPMPSISPARTSVAATLAAGDDDAEWLARSSFRAELASR